uniref:NADH dehydrogenase subunit 6 n=1 Tax=Onychiurus orientalis TaxID=280588 RepID=Q6DVH0_ONYOR|nr:NADH dehydrogenase subunit 6 [Onychiurus orientalis]AAT69329.1 NADH dehydrogenase subunit 6 [Onychiurus orientalis]
MIFLTLSVIVSTLFYQANHPITAMLIITCQTSLLCCLIFFILSMNWFSMMLSLIFMGGLMILFVYISSLASNEKFKLSFKTMTLPMISLVTYLSLTLLFKENYMFNNESEIFVYNIFFMYAQNIFIPVFLTMNYLLLVLVISVNIIKLYDAPMRSGTV